MSETTFTTEDEIAAQSVVEDHRAILATLHVVGSLAWFSGILGPLTSAAIVAVEYGLDCSHPSRDNGATLIERLVQRLNQQFEHSKVLDISSRLSAYGFFERALYERMAAIAEGEADNDDFLTAALEPGGYQTQLLNLLGAAGDNLMSLAFRYWTIPICLSITPNRSKTAPAGISRTRNCSPCNWSSSRFWKRTCCCW